MSTAIVAGPPNRKRTREKDGVNSIEQESNPDSTSPNPSAATATATASVSVSSSRITRSRRKHNDVDYDDNDKASSASVPANSSSSSSAEAVEVDDPEQDFANKSSSSSSSKKKKQPAPRKSSQFQAARLSSQPPADWKRVYVGIEKMRLQGVARNAPVDTVGCEGLSTSVKPMTKRFQTLVSLMLSAQTKDAVTAQAMRNLDHHFKTTKKTKNGEVDGDEITVTNILALDEAILDSLISKVGFHRRKAHFIKMTAAICAEQYNGDIPATLEELMALPGVGPKMAHLTMQFGWDKVVGIGVDTHVHRISNRLGWVKSQTPEQTRMQLQDWLPEEYWRPLNVMLVGFGQMVCAPIGPKCRSCAVNSLCPEGRRNLRYDKDPNKFYEPPPLESVDQIRKLDEEIAQRVLSRKSAAPMPTSSPPVVTSPFFAAASTQSSAHVKMEDEPLASTSAAAASSSSSSMPTVKQEPIDHVNHNSSDSSPGRPTVKLEPATDDETENQPMTKKMKAEK